MCVCMCQRYIFISFDKNKIVIRIFEYFIFLSNKFQINCMIKCLYNFDNMYTYRCACDHQHFSKNII